MTPDDDPLIPDASYQITKNMFGLTRSIVKWVVPGDADPVWFNFAALAFLVAAVVAGVVGDLNLRQLREKTYAMAHVCL